MTNECLSATLTINAPADTVFAIIADPASHAAIDGTGWVRDPGERQPLTESGQIFRMAMYHPNHPKGNYEMANLVQVFDPPYAISWTPGYDPGDGVLRFGGWIWRYDLAPLGQAQTEVRLSYDWSAVPEQVRRTGPAFPPFRPDHLHNSLHHLAELVP
ncbi:MAG TPA: polyketide cyclase [Mycobacteriales bacterium]|jgi:hypothetical protein|nr:polyketide cyclase [Mycobacteriales bacterium]